MIYVDNSFSGLQLWNYSRSTIACMTEKDKS